MKKFARGERPFYLAISLFLALVICLWIAALLLTSASAAQPEELDHAIPAPLVEVELTEESQFFPNLDLLLSPELQEYTYQICQENDILYSLMLAVMSVESTFNPDAVGYNQNSHDIGLCQINSMHLAAASKANLNLYLPKDNIVMGCRILSEYLERYPVLSALAAYNAGEYGMQQGRGYSYAQRVLAEQQNMEQLLKA